MRDARGCDDDRRVAEPDRLRFDVREIVMPLPEDDRNEVDRDFVELTSSLYITSYANKLQDEIAIPMHPQFDLAFPDRATAGRVDRGAWRALSSHS